MSIEIEYALMAGASYISTRTEINRFPAPDVWLEAIVDREVKESGFEATYFAGVNNEIVISYAGTYPSSWGDWGTNLALAAGNLSVQLIQAAEYYLRVKAANPDATISFTGHSLGGGLASLMAVFFGGSAYTFDQAPFLNAATRTPSIDVDGNLVPSTAENLRAALTGKGYDLSSLDTFIAAQAETLATRSTNVKNINVEGEFISSWFLVPSSNRIGSQGDIANSNNIGILDGIELHSQALLTAFLQSGDTVNSTPENHTLGQVTFKLTDLLKMIFDPKLYSFDTAKDKENFLERLVKHEAGVQGSITADAMLTRFTADLWKLAQEGGMTLHDGNTNEAIHDLSNALIAFAMQKYYEEKTTSDGYRKELFTQITGGLQFDMADVSEKFKTAFDNNEKLTLTDAKGFDLYLKSYFDNNLDLANNFSVEEDALILSILPYMRDWYIQAGTSGMNVTDTQNRGAFIPHSPSLAEDKNLFEVLGGTQADALVGNAANDNAIHAWRIAA